MQPPKLKLSWKIVLFPLLGLAGFFMYIYLFRHKNGIFNIKIQRSNKFCGNIFNPIKEFILIIII